MAIRNTEVAGPDVTVAVHDVLTPEDVLTIRALVRRQVAGTKVTVDLRSARTCPAHALLMLASLRSPSGGPVTVVGLTGPSERMLRYFDIPVRRASAVEEPG